MSANKKESTPQERMTICRKCEYLEKALSRCTKCGCFMNFKTRLKKATCPIGKW